jgi:hypothetical protein
MHKFQLQTFILRSQALEAEPSFLLGATHSLPGHEAFCPRYGASHVPKESMAQGLDRTEQGGREFERSHGEAGDGVQDRIQQDHPATR